MLLFAVKRYQRSKEQSQLWSPALKPETAKDDQPQADGDAAAAFLQKMSDLRIFLDLDLPACDVKFLLFVAAAMNYRYESLLQPCPQNYMKANAQLDVDLLYESIINLPKMHTVLRSIDGQKYEDFRMPSLDLLHWIVVENRDPCLRSLSHDEVKYFCKCVCTSGLRRLPKHVFEVISYEYTERVYEYCSLRDTYSAQIAFYGGRLEQFYSLLNMGCLPDNKPLLLSTDLNEAIRRSPIGAGWGASEVSGLVKCIAVCEVLQKNEALHITVDPENEHSHDVIVLDYKYMRVSHLILYSQDIEKRLQRPRRDKMSAIEDWLKEHECVASLLAYASLVSISCFVFCVATRRSA